MSSPLVTLAPEIVCHIIKELPIEDGRIFLESCKNVYNNGIYAFDEKCFRAIPVRLTKQGLDLAKQLLKEHSIHYLQEIFIRLRDGLVVFGSEEMDIQNALISVLTQGLQVSTQPLTISIWDHPERFNDPSGGCMKIVAQAISTILSVEPTKPFKVQIQNLRLGNCRWLFLCGRPFLDRVQSLELRFDHYTSGSRALKGIKKVLPLASNLEELSLSNNTEAYLSSETFQQIISKSIPKKLKRVIITGVSISATELREALSPFHDYLRELKLENVVFQDESFDEFIDYVVNHLAVTLDSYSVKDIYEDRGEDVHKILDPMKECREMGVSIWGFDIMKGLDGRKSDSKAKKLLLKGKGS
ncbi:MAG: hypothetical protein CL912_19055 [Deltaproteobacteria bacterium]|jgi:hypothetical protein|nr:hypothetical protein [Deltaproteobacteria bacterium]